MGALYYMEGTLYYMEGTLDYMEAGNPRLHGGWEPWITWREP